MSLPGADDKGIAAWCVMEHARPVLVKALRAWGMGRAASEVGQAASLSVLKIACVDADVQVYKRIVFPPLRRDLSHALATLQAAATFAARGDVENTAAVVIGVFTHAASALTWRRPWTRLTWRRRRAEVIAGAQREQAEHLSSPLSPPVAPGGG
jgi:hypothetical protein